MVNNGLMGIELMSSSYVQIILDILLKEFHIYQFT